MGEKKARSKWWQLAAAVPVGILLVLYRADVIGEGYELEVTVAVLGAGIVLLVVSAVLKARRQYAADDRARVQ